MAITINHPILLVSIAVAIAVSGCGNTKTLKTEKFDGVEWNVSVNKVVEYTDTILGISTEYDYTVADTARINTTLKGMQKFENICVEWTLPSADGSIWLVAYEPDPIINENVTITEVNSIPSYGGNIQVAFKFPDAKKWEAVTFDNIGKRLAVKVNGQLMNAPQVNTEISSGNCSVAIPSEMIHEYLSNIVWSALKAS